MQLPSEQIQNHQQVLLEVKRVTKTFGGLTAVNGVDFSLMQGEILGLIGPNGAGKSTLLNMVGGTIPVKSGKVVFKNRNITRVPDYRRARIGIARVFQRNAYFTRFTVIENVLIGLPLHYPPDQAGAEKAEEILDYVGLLKHARERAANLPHGKLRTLSVAIALACQPRLLLLDEPLTGMNAHESATMSDLISRLRNEMGVSCIIVEHNMKAIVGLCDKLLVLNYGTKIAEGMPASVIQSPEVVKAYLGESYHAA